MPPIVYPAGERSGPARSHVFGPPATPEGWTSVVLTEWELVGEEWVDEHPHEEINYVLDGTLFVESDGVTVEVGRGSVVSVPAGTTGRYWAPDRALMLAVYGPNPEGLPSRVDGLRTL